MTTKLDFYEQSNAIHGATLYTKDIFFHIMDMCDLQISHRNISFNLRDAALFFLAHTNKKLYNLMVLYRKSKKIEFERLSLSAAYMGSLKSLKWFYSYGGIIDHHACEVSASQGHLKCLEFSFPFRSVDYSSVAEFAVKNKQLECLKYILQNDKYSNKIAEYAARYGDINSLKYLKEEGYFDLERKGVEATPFEISARGTKFTTADLLEEAASGGQMECLKYLYEERHNMPKGASMYAGANGHLECMKYAHEKNNDWNGYTTAAIAKEGHLECLKYAHENGCRWTNRTGENAVENGHLDCAKYAHDNGYEWDDGDVATSCFEAARKGHFDCVDYLHETGYNCGRTCEKYIESLINKK